MKRLFAALIAGLLVTGITAPALAMGRGGPHGSGGSPHGSPTSGGLHHGGVPVHGPFPVHGGGFHGGFREGVFAAPYGDPAYPYWYPYAPLCDTMPGKWVWNGYQWVWQPPQTVCN